MTDATHHLFWITSRAAGVAALLLSSAAVSVGLLMGAKIRGGGSAATRRTLHESLSLSVMVALAIHALSLMADSYLRPSLLDVTVPFAFSYKTLATSLGIVSGWGIVILGLSYYVRGRIGVSRWRVIHRLTLLAWLGGIVHALVEGTDARQQWFEILAAMATAPVLSLLAARFASAPRSAPRASPRTP